jgi:hypothetical protein
MNIYNNKFLLLRNLSNRAAQFVLNNDKISSAYYRQAMKMYWVMDVKMQDLLVSTPDGRGCDDHISIAPATA